MTENIVKKVCAELGITQRELAERMKFKCKEKHNGK
jgi:hypothetical protein